MHRHDEDGRAIAEEVSIEGERLLVTLPDRLIEVFGRMADIRDKSPSAALADHLASLFAAGDGIDKEVFFFNQHRPSRTTTGTEILIPRPAQRAMLFQTMRRVRELYTDV
ncbi:hypothetical protein WJ78_24435 [Burkholderia ubonensis]|uniref:hypothetical protein n=1 Tax=Burkholderia ubonensis TaxID=101571 RepID=UPI00075370DC|nr:hypothetical protein [Burkholderia ubonensis]KVO60437.1 hypothetical protein WJ78_24435 [Burkholderia ubonensis]KVP91202.1 hypothetical protein WJ97_03530 [Burkholderia ubonensis]OJB44987.1 hypothetical protein BGV57_06000 [Burkholderia ubonensis]